MFKSPLIFHNKLTELYANLRTDFLESCGQGEGGEIQVTDKAKGISIAMKRIEKLIDENRVQTINMIGD